MTTLTDREVIERARAKAVEWQARGYDLWSPELLDVLSAASTGPCRHPVGVTEENCPTCISVRCALDLLRKELGDVK